MMGSPDLVSSSSTQGAKHGERTQDDDDDPEIAELQKELKALRTKIAQSRQAARDIEFGSIATYFSPIQGLRMKGRKILKGHIAKVVAVDFAGDSKHALSASLDGKMMIWDTWSGNKVRIIPVVTSWIMAAAYESSGRFVAVGGMDNMCTVYDLEKKWTGDGDADGGLLGAAIARELAGLRGGLSCCMFVQQDKVIVGSADTSVHVFDLASGRKLHEYTAHDADVVGLSLRPTDNNMFVTASMDSTCRLFDLRHADQCWQTFGDHALEVNDVCFQHNGSMFTTCSEDKTCRLFDIRSDLQVAEFQEPTRDAAFTSVLNSKSDRLLLAGADDDTVHVWDLVGSQKPEECHLGNLWGHDARIASMAMSPNGMAIVTGSWDSSVRIWA